MRLLVRREHTARELADKLRRKGLPAQAIDAALEEIRARGWQSDRRYAEALVRTRVEAGYGPLRIEQDLRRAGVDEAIIHDVLAAVEQPWETVAKAAWQRRFRGAVPKDRREWARQARFLQYRGFPAEIVRAVLAAAGHCGDEW